jgi:amino acid transporter/mannitol/fructose-specific phosphotransferase system IIA component (Ntr-type)
MAILSRSRRLRKELRLLDVYAIATGATLSAGFFLLPGLAAAQCGPALVLAYLIAAVPMIPGMFSAIELATAMPRAGGVYYFLDRSFGPLVGTLGGIGTWLVVALKVAFALVGMGAYLELFLPALPLVPLALSLALLMGVISLLGARMSSGFQVFLALGVLAILAAFIGGGLPFVQATRFEGFFDPGFGSILSTAGFVYISYIGVTQVASLAEEVKDPERNLPLGVFLALGTSILVYGVGTFVLVGLVPMDELAGDLTPVATAAHAVVGTGGIVVLSVAAILAFTSVANAGTLSASRYPLAMSRDHLAPEALRRLDRRGTPIYSIIATVSLIAAILLFLDPTRIAKLASAFQLSIFALVCLAVIVMRESRIESYDPGYRSPGYPWMQIAGVVAALVLIAELGRGPALFTGAVVVLGCAWYFFYGRRHVHRAGALLHVFERLGQRRYSGLDPELRSILKEKGLRDQDPFEEIVARAFVIHASERQSFEKVILRASELLARRIPRSAAELQEAFLQGTLVGATPVERGVALPHLRVAGVETPEMVLIRSRSGLRIPMGNVLGETRTSEPTYAVFVLVSPEHDPAQHLRLLAQLASRVEEENFQMDWLEAASEHSLKEVLLRSERYLSIALHRGGPVEPLIGRAIREISIPEGCLVAFVRRRGQSKVPGGNTVLREGDWLTLIGSPQGIRKLHELYGEEPQPPAAGPRRSK